MNLHYDHPILLLQHMLWHEGYHHGQIKLALKVAGRPLTDEEARPVTWDVWMRKNRPPCRVTAASEGQPQPELQPAHRVGAADHAERRGRRARRHGGARLSEVHDVEDV